MDVVLLALDQSGGLVVVAIAVALTLGLLLFGLFGTPPEERALAQRLVALRVRHVASERVKTAATLRRDTTDSSIRQLDSLVKRWMPQRIRLRERLEATGIPINIGHYLLASFALAIVVAALVSGFTRLSPAIALGLGLVTGAAMPNFTVSYLAARRRKAFIALFPEAIDLIVRGLKSGLPVTESISIVAREIGDPVSTEFRHIEQGVQLGRTIEDMMWETSRRIEVAEFKFFVISLTLQRETGGNLAETLEKLSDILRRRRQMQQKIKAMSSEARASAMIIGSLPFIMTGILFAVSPDYIITLFQDPRGHLFLAAGGLSLAIGIGVMAKMVKFEI